MICKLFVFNNKQHNKEFLKKVHEGNEKYEKSCIFAASNENDGALAQLARAFDWQSRGREFDSHTLHKKHLQ